MPAGLIALLTDFGADSPYVAHMKGVILSICPNTTIVDVTHAIPPQDVSHGAQVLRGCFDYFPPETVFVNVVDPGVGTGRRIIAVEANRKTMIAPDNGLISLVPEDHPPREIVECTNKETWLPTISATFHGRDIMAPTAAHICNGFYLRDLGPSLKLEEIQQLQIDKPAIADRSVTGKVVTFDSFGNLITNIKKGDFPESHESLKIEVGGKLILNELVSAYGFADPGEVVALFGSTEFLEIACVNGNAFNDLDFDSFPEISISW